MTLMDDDSIKAGPQLLWSWGNYSYRGKFSPPVARGEDGISRGVTGYSNLLANSLWSRYQGGHYEPPKGLSTMDILKKEGFLGGSPRWCSSSLAFAREPGEQIWDVIRRHLRHSCGMQVTSHTMVQSKPQPGSLRPRVQARRVYTDTRNEASLPCLTRITPRRPGFGSRRSGRTGTGGLLKNPEPLANTQQWNGYGC
ncbi:hypothetical protein GWK47_022702 [Chionoecetes opilio]|uniref:Uncharacterized protein n=1 Tax=Chionoecetes opilio TaxID=41210 RepID=A0A8J4XN06_CHIOP|nr:hypothetical protein GWK47_022702 [Chionoecetes opilio]